MGEAELSARLRRDAIVLLVHDKDRAVEATLRNGGFLKVRHWDEAGDAPVSALREADLVVLVVHGGAPSDEIIRQSEQRWVVVFSREHFPKGEEFDRCAPANNELTLLTHCESVLRIRALSKPA